MKNQKCYWEKGSFHPCGRFSGRISKDFHGRSICSACGADIRKPPEEDSSKPLTIRSGDTVVMRRDGKDFLWVGELIKLEEVGEKQPIGKWVPFEEIEITDEIAKLRPMVEAWDNQNGARYTEKLLAIIDGERKYVTLDLEYLDVNSFVFCRLLTYSELKELKEEKGNA